MIAPATSAPSGQESQYQWLQFDRVELFNTEQATLGTECFEPGSFVLVNGLPGPPGLPPVPEPESDADGGPSDALAMTYHATHEAAAVAATAPMIVEARAVPLTVGVGGTAAGTVTSTNPTGLTCGPGATCTGLFGEGSTVTLTATPGAGATFAGWTGACTHQNLTCHIFMEGSEQAFATFTGPPVLTFYHLDALGSVRAVTGGTGPNYTIIKRHDYFGW